MFWNKKKKAESDSVVWRDKTGKIACRGDTCPKDCDNSCPIWLNTLGLQMLQRDEPLQAIPFFQGAVSIAPDFADAYNNLGGAYGSSNQHEKAYEFFGKALELKRDYPNAMYGMIVAAKNLGKYDEALKYCDAYDRLPGCSAAELRQDIEQLAAGKQSNPQQSGNWMLLAAKLLQSGREKGYIQSEGFPQIPELMVCAEPTCLKILDAELDYEEDHPEAKKHGAMTVYSWAAFAGMGAVYHWNEDWNALSKAGVYETMTKERGFFAMDEYVLDTIGIPFGSDQCKEFLQFIFGLTAECMGYISNENSEASAIDTLIYGAKAMYAFGVVFEMNRLGMR